MRAIESAGCAQNMNGQRRTCKTCNCAAERKTAFVCYRVHVIQARSEQQRFTQVDENISQIRFMYFLINLYSTCLSKYIFYVLVLLQM